MGRRSWISVGLAVACWGSLWCPAWGPSAIGQDASSPGRDVAADDQTRHDLVEALRRDPASTDALAELLRLDIDDAGARRLWALHAALAGADANGRVAFPRDGQRSWPREAKDDLAFGADLARRHAKALRAVRAALGRIRGVRDHGRLLWLAALGRALAAGGAGPDAQSGAGLGAGVGAGVGEGLEAAIAAAHARTQPAVDAITGALLDVAGKARAAGDLDAALEAARTVRGLHQQANQNETAGAVPSGDGERAARLIALLRRELRDREAPAASPEPGADNGPGQDAAPPNAHRIWRVPELEAIPDEERAAWSAEHDRWGQPGVAVSPSDRYRVETVSGLATLLAVTRDAEGQHARLVKWFGQDPFLERPGLIRISPDYRDFEAEGQAFWWAGGFQSGDLTNLIARFATREALASTLTHELTHRFDGALYPGMPAWLVEGRATFTETGTLHAESTEVREEFVAWQRLWQTGRNGYGSADGLRKLLEGRVDDYRHNYDAGYSLFTFLRRFRGFDDAQDGAAVFLPRLDAYLRSFRERARDAAEARFTVAFCDGADGRPEDFETAGAWFGRFLREGGSGAEEPAAWKRVWMDAAQDAWNESGARGAAPSRIFDRPTYRPSRTRHDRPDHGQYHARVAAELLLAGGARSAAVDAIHWALRADEPVAPAFARAAEICAAAGAGDHVWVLQSLAHQHDRAGRSAPPGTASGALAAAGRAAADLASRYAAASDEALAAGDSGLARALRADGDRLAFRAGLPEQGPLAHDADPDESTEPWSVPYRTLLGAQSPQEVRWAPLDSRPGPWHVPDGGDALELGRGAGARVRTGALRDARHRRTFVETQPWLQGTYSVRTRVRFVSSFASGALVVGKSHRDRGVQIGFQGGDWEYAVGDSDEGTPLSLVHVDLRDLGEWGRATTRQSEDVAFTSPRQVFDVEVQVSGPVVRVLVNDVLRITHRRATGSPVDGRVGFALSGGIIRFEEPATRPIRALGPEREAPGLRLDAALDPGRHGTFAWRSVVGRRVTGIEPAPHGTMVLWYPAGTPPERYDEAHVVDAAVASFAPWFRSLPGVVRYVVALPPEAADDHPLLAPGATLPPDVDRVLRHAGHDGLDAAIRSATELDDGSIVYRGYASVPVWFVLDDRGVVRSAAPWDGPVPAIELVRALAGR